MADEQEQDGNVEVQMWEPPSDDGVPGHWDTVKYGLPTHTAGRLWIKANLKPGQRFRIIKVLQEGTVRGKDDIQAN